MNSNVRALVDQAEGMYPGFCHTPPLGTIAMRRVLKVAGLLCLCAIWASVDVATATAQDRSAAGTPLLEVLRETGLTRDGVPVLEPHPDAARYVAGLARGLSGRLLRLYALEQHYLQVKNGTAPEPAYLLISSTMGGFPRFGFYLGSHDKRTAGYVDLRVDPRIGGRFGAMDQIFPHELGHVILTQLAGLPQHGGSNQMHAIGVRTDAFNAFNEGFAEHFQVLALDDPDALSETRELLRDDFFERRSAMQLREYAQELEALWPVPGRRRVVFPLWFSSNEQALRFYAVKANAFARQPRIPARLLRADPYEAYLLENVMPGRPSDAPKNPAQLVSSEGVVAAFFVAWATSGELQHTRREAAFYAPFGVTPASVTPFENAYLKLFHAFSVSRPADLPAAIAGYKACFPDEAPAVDRLVRRIALGQSLDGVARIWLANDDFRIGTSVFDQFRSLPRVHTFDLNAASEVDLVAVPGVSSEMADAIRRRSPYHSLEDLHGVKGMSASLMDRFRALERRAAARRRNGADDEASFSFGAIVRPYLWRLAVLVLLTGVLGAVAYRLAVPRTWPHAVANGIAAIVVGLVLEVALDFPRGVLAVVGPLLFLGVPAALYCLLFPGRTARRVAASRVDGHLPTRGRLALAVWFAWILAALPLVLVLTPHF